MNASMTFSTQGDNIKSVLWQIRPMVILFGLFAAFFAKLRFDMGNNSVFYRQTYSTFCLSFFRVAFCVINLVLFSFVCFAVSFNSIVADLLAPFGLIIVMEVIFTLAFKVLLDIGFSFFNMTSAPLPNRFSLDFNTFVSVRIFFRFFYCAILTLSTIPVFVTVALKEFANRLLLPACTANLALHRIVLQIKTALRRGCLKVSPSRRGQSAEDMIVLCNIVYGNLRLAW
jgi:hypothetical protein